MITYLTLIILIASLVGAVVLIIRKFPQLANLDVDNLPEELESRKKKEIIDRRVVSEKNKMLLSFLKRIAPVEKIWGKLQLKFRIYVGRIERLFHHEQRSKVKAERRVKIDEDSVAKVAALTQEADQYLQQNNLEKAEELFIAAVKLDPKCAAAYRGLGDTYLAQESLDEAGETYKFLLQIQPEDDNAMVKVSELFEKKGSLEESINYLQQAVVLNDSLSPRFHHLAELLLKINQPSVAKEAIVQAVELEPKNPKYLDLLIEIGILCSDKDLAKQGFQELRLVNPENQKLESFQARISEMV